MIHCSHSLVCLKCSCELVLNTYVMKEFVEIYQDVIPGKRGIAKLLYYAVYCFLYTGFVFWGVKLSIDKLKIKNVYLAVWIIFQYSAGVICLAYLANYIITK